MRKAASACLIGSVSLRMFPRMYKVAKILTRRGVRVRAICISTRAHESTLPEEEVVDGIRVREIRPILLPLIRTLKLIPAALLLSYPRAIAEILRGQDDVYHFFHLYTLVLAPFVKLLKRKLVFYDGIENYPYSMSESLASWFRLLRWGLAKKLIYGAVRALEMWLIRNFVDQVFTVDIVGDILYKRYKRVADKVVVIKNVPEAEASIDEELRRELLRKYAGYKLVVYVGAVNKDRGCLVMVKAVKEVSSKVPNVKLLLIGPVTDEEFMEEAAEFIKEHGLEEHIDFIGPIPYTKIHTYLHIGDVALALFQPDTQYLLSRGSAKLFLYMRAGLPIIVSDFPGMRAIVEKARCGILVNPTDVSAVAEAIIKLLKDVELARMMGENGRRAVLSEYNLALEEEKIFHAYKERLGWRFETRGGG